MTVKLRILSTDAKIEDIKGAGIRIKKYKHNYWGWEHIFSDGRIGPIIFGFDSKEDAIENIRALKRDLSNDDMPIYVCVGE